MSDDTRRCLFRESESKRLVEINPALVRLVRSLDNGSEIVFSEAHSITVIASRPAIVKAMNESLAHRAIAA